MFFEGTEIIGIIGIVQEMNITTTIHQAWIMGNVRETWIMERAVNSIMNAIRHLPQESTQIFLGDASVSVRDLNAALLYRAGPQGNAEANAESGWETLQEKDCNLLVINYKLPGHTGLRLIVKIRAAQMTSPVVLTSITIDADELSRNSRFQLAATHTKTLTAGQLLELAVAVLQIAGTTPVGVHPLALIESIERHLQSD